MDFALGSPGAEIDLPGWNCGPAGVILAPHFGVAESGKSVLF